MRACRAKPPEERIVYASHRFHGNTEFRGSYRPTGPIQLRERGSLEHWLTERYCLYTLNAGCVHRAEIHHQPWPLQDAEAEIQVNTMTEAAGIWSPANSSDSSLCKKAGGAYLALAPSAKRNHEGHEVTRSRPLSLNLRGTSCPPGCMDFRSP